MRYSGALKPLCITLGVFADAFFGVCFSKMRECTVQNEGSAWHHVIKHIPFVSLCLLYFVEELDPVQVCAVQNEGLAWQNEFHFSVFVVFFPLVVFKVQLVVELDLVQVFNRCGHCGGSERHCHYRGPIRGILAHSADRDWPTTNSRLDRHWSILSRQWHHCTCHLVNVRPQKRSSLININVIHNLW